MTYCKKILLTSAFVLSACSTVGGTGATVHAAADDAALRGVTCINAQDAGFETFDGYLSEGAYTGIAGDVTDAQKQMIMNAAKAQFGAFDSAFIGLRQNPLDQKIIALQVQEPYDPESDSPPTRAVKGCLMELR